MPDPRLDHHLTRDELRALLFSPYTYAEQERLDALAKPWPVRWLAYLMWLTEAMPDHTGSVLMIAILLGGMSLLSAGIGLVLLLLQYGIWLFCLLGGIVLGVVGRAVLRDAAATELEYRQRIADKQQKQREKEGKAQ